MKKFIALLLTVVLTATVAIGGTVAYLQDEDSDVNVMTLGNVKIEQHEYQRVVNADGTYATGTVDDQTSYKLEAFEQGKPLLPATELDANGNPYNYGAGGWDSTTVRMSQVDSYGGMQVFTSKNAQDKFVTVENTGMTDAYIRTLVAIEIGSTDGSLIGSSYHGTWAKTEIGQITIDGNNYMLFEYAYEGGELSDGTWRHKNGILPAGDTSYPNLSQVYISAEATNEDMVALDGNGNGTLDILVVSQAVQVDGFADAETALNAAFGDITTTNHPWTDGVVLPDKFVRTFDELKAAFAEGGNILLGNDIAMEGRLDVEDGVKVHLNMNGKKIAAGTIDPDNFPRDVSLWVKKGGSLTIDGNGTFDLGANPGLSFIAPQGEVVIENGTFIREVPAGTNPAAVVEMFIGTKSGSLVIKDGYFDGGYYDKNAELAFNGGFTETADDIANRGRSKDANVVRVALKNNVMMNLNMSAANVKVYGGTFVGVNPAWGDEGCMLPTTPDYLRPWSYYQGAFLDGQTFNENGIVLPAGYSIAQGTTADGRPTYTVNYNG